MPEMLAKMHGANQECDRRVSRDKMYEKATTTNQKMDLKVGNTWPETFNLSAYFVFIRALARTRKANNLCERNFFVCSDYKNM